MWHLTFVENIRNVGYSPWEADHNLLMRDMENHLEYVAVVSDDILVFRWDPDMIIEILK